MLSSKLCVILATMIELAHGDMLLWMIPASNKFFISCFRKLWCLRAKGYSQAVTGAESGLVAMCISIRSVSPMSLSLLEIMESNI